MAAPKGNKYAVGNNGGRPLIWESPEAMQEAIDEYFNSTKKITINGLALHLGFVDRQSLYDYQNREEFSAIIKKARSKVQGYYEQNLMSNHATGAIFALKNMGWTDRQDINYKGESQINLSNLSDEEKKQLVELKRKLDNGK